MVHGATGAQDEMGVLLLTALMEPSASSCCRAAAGCFRGVGKVEGAVSLAMAEIGRDCWRPGLRLFPLLRCCRRPCLDMLGLWACSLDFSTEMPMDWNSSEVLGTGSVSDRTSAE